MEKTLFDVSLLDNCRISIVKGRGCRCEEEKTAAVIELDSDISPVMPGLSRIIDTCGYNAEAKVMAFRAGGHGVVINADKITIVDAAEAKTALDFLDWLKEKIKSAG
jgi:ArsR family metal-binding transcriptional regulator